MSKEQQENILKWLDQDQDQDFDLDDIQKLVDSKDKNTLNQVADLLNDSEIEQSLKDDIMLWLEQSIQSIVENKKSSHWLWKPDCFLLQLYWRLKNPNGIDIWDKRWIRKIWIDWWGWWQTDYVISDFKSNTSEVVKSDVDTFENKKQQVANVSSKLPELEPKLRNKWDSEQGEKLDWYSKRTLKAEKDEEKIGEIWIKEFNRMESIRHYLEGSNSIIVYELNNWWIEKWAIKIAELLEWQWRTEDALKIYNKIQRIIKTRIWSYKADIKSSDNKDVKWFLKNKIDNEQDVSRKIASKIKKISV